MFNLKGICTVYDSIAITGQFKKVFIISLKVRAPYPFKKIVIHFFNLHNFLFLSVTFRFFCAFLGDTREKKRKELMDARNHRILPTPNSDEPLSYLNLGPTPYPNSGPTPYPNPRPTPYPNPTTRPNPSPTPYPAQSKARATPFPIMQTSAATAQMFSPMYNQYNAQSVYNKPADLYNKPADLYNKPADLYNKPAALNNKPADLYNKPADLYNKPAVLYNKPADLYNKPADLYNKPTDLYKKPANMYHKPAELYNKPADLYNKPADLYNKPDDLHNNPADLYTKQRTEAEEKIAKDKAYNYDYIIGDTKDKEETDTVLPFMNNIPIQQKVHFVIFVLIIIILVLERMNYKVSIIYNIIHSYISFFYFLLRKKERKIGK